MRIRLVLAVLVALSSGGCLKTTHEHFDAKNGVTVPLKGGLYECRASARGMPGSSERPPPSVFTNHPTLSLFFGTMEIRQLAGTGRYMLMGPKTTKVVAFHKIVEDIYVVASPDEKPGGQSHWFFRITEGTLSPLWQAKPEELGALGQRLGVLVSEDGPGPATIQGAKADERAFIDAYVKLPGVVAMSTCTFTHE